MTVPGLVEAWGELHGRFGRLDLATCLEPAIRLARSGFPLGIEEANEWATEARKLAPDAHEMFLPGGTAPVAWQRLANPAQARVLESIAADGPRHFYQGWAAEAIVRAATAHGSAMTTADVAAHYGEWVEPLAAARYADWEVVELPPNGDGAVVVGALGILADDDARHELLSARRVTARPKQ